MAPLFVVNLLRQFVMIPQAISLVPLLAVWQSCAAIDVAMNALATVFILEVDNLVFEHVLSEQTRTATQKKGKVLLDAQTSRELDASKYAHFVFVSLAIVWGVCGGRT